MKLVILGFLTAACFAADWDARLAEQFLDERQKLWNEWPAAAADGGACVSCHTGLPYVMARPGTEHAEALRAGLRKRLASGGTMFKKRAADYDAVNAVITAAVLRDEASLDRMWTLQGADGAWPWFDLNLNPFETASSVFYGATLAAVASREDRRESAANGRAKLLAYLVREESRQPLHHRLFLLGAAPEVLPERARRAIAAEARKRQQSDGGWTMEAIGPFPERPAAPAVSGSSAYATALAAYGLRGAADGENRRAIEAARKWLVSHQDAAGGWQAKSMNKVYPAGSHQEQFMSEVASAFAVMALREK